MSRFQLQHNSTQRGFTLVELVMVMVIIGTLSAIAITKFNPGSFEITADSGELVSAIRYAQEKSMSNTGATDYQIVIGAGGYTVQLQGGGSVPHPVTGAASYSSNWSNVTLSPTGTITFDGYGEPSLSGSLAFSGNQEVITVAVGSENRTIAVEQTTGFVR